VVVCNRALVVLLQVRYDARIHPCSPILQGVLGISERLGSKISPAGDAGDLGDMHVMEHMPQSAEVSGMQSSSDRAPESAGAPSGRCAAPLEAADGQSTHHWQQQAACAACSTSAVLQHECCTYLHVHSSSSSAVYVYIHIYVYGVHSL
jgi:hypothetical protein